MSTISNTNQTIATNDYSSLLWRIELLEKEVKELRNSSSKRSSRNSATKKNEHFRITMLKAEATANKKAVTAEKKRLITQKKAAKQAEKKQKAEAATAKKKESISIIQSLFV